MERMTVKEFNDRVKWIYDAEAKGIISSCQAEVELQGLQKMVCPKEVKG